MSFNFILRFLNQFNLMSTGFGFGFGFGFGVGSSLKTFFRSVNLSGICFNSGDSAEFGLA